MTSLENQSTQQLQTNPPDPRAAAAHEGGAPAAHGQVLHINPVDTGLHQSHETLQECVAQMSRDNERLHSEVVQANQVARKADQANIAKSAFLTTMSHELRSPLTAVLGFAELLADPRNGALTEQQLGYIGFIREGGEHLLRLVNDLVDLARVEAGRMALRLEQVSVRELCESCVQLTSPLAAKKNILLTPELAGAPEEWHTDPQRLRQILLNLLSNAIKFTPKGGLVGLDVAVDADGRQLRLTVWDTGIGIAPEDQARLFEAFFQVDSPLSRQYPGTGLGLRLVEHFCRFLGGKVTVMSVLGEGSRFTVTLPVKQGAPQVTTDELQRGDEAELQQGVPAPAAGWSTDAASELPTATAPVSDPRYEVSQRFPGSSTVRPLVLLVDDDADLLSLYSHGLTVMGNYRVLEASSGTQALRFLEERCPTLIVTDIQMPDLDGVELIRRVRQSSPPLNGVPIIALTGLAMAGDRDRFLAAGADICLTKPAALQDLRATVELLLKSAANMYGPASSSMAAELAASIPRSTPSAVSGQGIEPQGSGTAGQGGL